MTGRRFAVFGAQRFEQFRQAVVIDFLHQGQETAQFAVGESFTGEPIEVRAGQVGDDSAFVFAEGHLASNQQFELFRVHQSDRLDSMSLENTGILHAGQMTDHANKTDTDFLLKIK